MDTIIVQVYIQHYCLAVVGGDVVGKRPRLKTVEGVQINTSER